MINLTKLPWIPTEPTLDYIIHSDWRTYRIHNEYSVSTIFQLNFNPKHDLDILASDDLHYMAIYHITNNKTNNSYLYSTVEGKMVDRFLDEFDELYFKNTIRIINADDFLHIFQNVYENNQAIIPHTIYLSLNEIDQLYHYANNDISTLIKKLIGK